MEGEELDSIRSPLPFSSSPAALAMLVPRTETAQQWASSLDASGARQNAVTVAVPVQGEVCRKEPGYRLTVKTK
jgi:hypothetical protein